MVLHMLNYYIILESESTNTSHIFNSLYLGNFPGGSVERIWLPMQEMWVLSLGQEEEETATHSNILAWEIKWTEQPGGIQSIRSQELDVIKHFGNYYF